MINVLTCEWTIALVSTTKDIRCTPKYSQSQCYDVADATASSQRPWRRDRLARATNRITQVSHTTRATQFESWRHFERRQRQRFHCQSASWMRIAGPSPRRQSAGNQRIHRKAVSELAGPYHVCYCGTQPPLMLLRGYQQINPIKYGNLDVERKSTHAISTWADFTFISMCCLRFTFELCSMKLLHWGTQRQQTQSHAVAFTSYIFLALFFWRTLDKYVLCF